MYDRWNAYPQLRENVAGNIQKEQAGGKGRRVRCGRVGGHSHRTVQLPRKLSLLLYHFCILEV